MTDIMVTHINATERQRCVSDLRLHKYTHVGGHKATKYYTMTLTFRSSFQVTGHV